MVIDAPTYPPAAAYEKPVPQPFVFNAENVTLGELMTAPAAWNVVLKHAPIMKMMVNNETFRPHLYNFTAAALAEPELGLLTKETLAKMNADLAALPQSERPQL